MLLGSVLVSIYWIFELLLTDVTDCWLLGKMFGLVMSMSMTGMGGFVSTAHAYEITIYLSDPISFILFWGKRPYITYILLKKGPGNHHLVQSSGNFLAHDTLPSSSDWLSHGLASDGCHDKKSFWRFCDRCDRRKDPEACALIESVWSHDSYGPTCIRMTCTRASCQPWLFQPDEALSENQRGERIVWKWSKMHLFPTFHLTIS